MTSGPPATEGMFGQLGLNYRPSLHMVVEYGALALITPGDTSTARKEEVGNLVAGTGARAGP